MKTNKNIDLTNLKRGSTLFINTGDSQRAYLALIVHHMSKGVFVQAESLSDYDVEQEHYYGIPRPTRLIPATEIASYFN